MKGMKNMLLNKGLRMVLAGVLSVQLAFGNVVPVMAAGETVENTEAENQGGATGQNPSDFTDAKWSWTDVNHLDENLVVDTTNKNITITTDKATDKKNVLYYELADMDECEFTVKVSGNFTDINQNAYLMISNEKNFGSAQGVVCGMQYVKMLGVESEKTVQSDSNNGLYLKVKKDSTGVTGYYATDYNGAGLDWIQITGTSLEGEAQVTAKGTTESEGIYLAIGANHGTGTTSTTVTFSELLVNGNVVPFDGLSGLEITPTLKVKDDSSIPVGDTRDLSLIVKSQNSAITYTRAKSVYTSENEAIVTVDSNTGKVTGITIGTGKIKAEVTVGNVSKTAECIVTVENAIEKERYNVESPNSNVRMFAIIMSDGTLRYTAESRVDASSNWTTTIPVSPIGIVTNLGDFSQNLKLIWDSGLSEVIKDDYNVSSGKKETYINRYRERVLTFGVKGADSIKFNLIMRAYDDGTAFRYRISTTEGNKNLQISKETTGLQLPAGSDVYWMDYIKYKKVDVKDESGKVVGQKDEVEWENYEGDYVKTEAKNLKKGTTPAIPLLYNSGNGNVWTLFTEADLHGSYCGSMVTVEDNGFLRMTFAKGQGDKPVQTTISSNEPFESPWRVAITGTQEDIIETTMVENLNPAPDSNADFSWVDPGMASWSWVADWGKGISDQSKKETHMKWIDLSAEMGWEYYILDENWMQNQRDTNKSIDSVNNDYRDWTDEVIKYANDKGVKLCVWMLSSTLKKPEYRQALFKSLSEKGIKAIKVDFFDSEDQETIQLYDDIYKDAAKNRLMVICHGTNKPTGEIRTYPNVLSREAIKGQEFGGITASQYTILPFVRGAIGPADVTEELQSKDYGKTTMGFQIALTALMENGIHSMGSAPDVYRSNDAAMSYYKNYPDHWDETQYVNSEIGQYVNIARRHEDNWYLSGISVYGRTLQIPLDFLEKDKDNVYTAMIYKENGRKAITRTIQSSVTSQSILEIPVLEGGGYAVRLIPASVINQVQVTGITAPKELEIEEGYEVTAEITVEPKDASFKDVIWSSADTNIATVTENGEIRGIQTGTTTVTVTSALKPEITSSIEVTVTPAQRVVDQSTWKVFRKNSNIQMNDDGSITIKAEEGVLGDDPSTHHNLFGMNVQKGTDFTITAKISGGLQKNYQGGFLLAFDADNPSQNHVAVGRRHHSYLMEDHPPVFGMMTKNSNLENVEEFYCEDKRSNDAVYIKLEKKGSLFNGYYSYDGKTWTTVTDNGTAKTITQEYLNSCENLCVGFYAGSGGEDAPIDITFSEFTYNGEEIPVALAIYEICEKLEAAEKAAAEAAVQAEAARVAQEKAEAAKAEAEKQKQEADAAKAEAEKKAEEVAIAKAEAEAAAAEAKKAQELAEQKKAEAEAAQAAAEQKANTAVAERTEAEQAKTKAEQAKVEAEQAKQEAERKAEAAESAQYQVEQRAEAAQKAKYDAEQREVQATLAKEDAERKAEAAEQEKLAAEQKAIEAEDAKHVAELKVVVVETSKVIAEQKVKAAETAMHVAEAKEAIHKAKADAAEQEAKEAKAAANVSVGEVCIAGNLLFKVTDVKKQQVGVCGILKHNLTTVVIPDSIQLKGRTYKVTEIAAQTFAKNKSLKNVVIGANVEKIGQKAFAKARKLKKVQITSTVLKTVEKGAFKGIHKKAKIKVPNTKLNEYKKLLKKYRVVGTKGKKK